MVILFIIILLCYYYSNLTNESLDGIALQSSNITGSNWLWTGALHWRLESEDPSWFCHNLNMLTSAILPSSTHPTIVGQYPLKQNPKPPWCLMRWISLGFPNLLMAEKVSIGPSVVNRSCVGWRENTGDGGWWLTEERGRMQGGEDNSWVRLVIFKRKVMCNTWKSSSWSTSS